MVADGGGYVVLIGEGAGPEIKLHGPSMLPDKAKFTICSIIKLATIAFDETSSYWSALKCS